MFLGSARRLQLSLRVTWRKLETPGAAREHNTTQPGTRLPFSPTKTATASVLQMVHADAHAHVASVRVGVALGGLLLGLFMSTYA